MLLEIRERICNLGTDQINLNEAEDAGILQYPMSLEQNSDNHPLYFTHYQKDFKRLYDPPYPDYEPDNENHLNIQHLKLYLEDRTMDLIPSEPAGIVRKAPARFNFGALFEADRFWQVSVTCSAAKTSEPLPHMKCMVHTDVIGDDRLLRSEIITMINAMVGRLNTKSVRPHLIAPVMLYSNMGQHKVRVLEAYFNGKNLIVRKTNPYDIREYNATTIDLLTRWWLGYAGGKTKQDTEALVS